MFDLQCDVYCTSARWKKTAVSKGHTSAIIARELGAVPSLTQHYHVPLHWYFSHCRCALVFIIIVDYAKEVSEHKKLALSSGHSMFFNVTHRTWEWPGDEASNIDTLCIGMISYNKVLTLMMKA